MSALAEYDVIVVGGGAAGMMAAGTCAARGKRTALLEKNRQLGRKVRITGKGRCNVTNCCSVEEAVAACPRGGKFLYGAFSAFPPEATMAFFEGLGVPLKTERGRRVFPQSDRAEDIVRALERYMRAGGVDVLHERAEAILAGGGGVRAVRTAEGDIECRSAVICTGGLSYPGTGSTGDGYRLAAALGHTVTPTRPSLVPLESPDGFCREMQGLALKYVRLTAFEDGREIFSELVEMLFTHFGVSGPLVLSASAHMRGFPGKKYRLSIDLKPALDAEKLDERVLRDFGKNKNREFRNALSELAPHALIPVLVERSGIAPETRVNSVTREQRRALVSLMKDFTISISGTRPVAEAIVTAGGVSTREVDPRSMQSRLAPGLYFAGEVLDLDAYTGGFNLQIAWSTAYVAANSLRS